MLTEAGLPTSVLPLELGVLLSRLDSGNYTLAILQIPELTEPHVLSWFFHPRGIRSGGLLGRNRAEYRNPQVAEWFDRAGATSECAERTALYSRIASQMLRDMPVVPLWHEDQVAVVRGRGQLFSPSSDGRFSSLLGSAD